MAACAECQRVDGCQCVVICIVKTRGRRAWQHVGYFGDCAEEISQWWLLNHIGLGDKI